MSDTPRDPAGIRAELVRCLDLGVADPARQWLDQALAELGQLLEPQSRLTLYFAQAARRLGSAPLPGATILESACGPLDTAHWRCCDAGRIALLLAAGGASTDRQAALVGAIHAVADDQERTSLVRGLALLADPPSHLDLALDAGRVNNVGLFAALALDNPYPAFVYPEPAFNQLVLKTLFLELPVARVHGLRRRANQELARMCLDYIDERLAAGRTIPVDIWLAVGPAADARALDLMLAYAMDSDPRHRYHASSGLAWVPDRPPEVERFLAQRRSVDPDPRVRAHLERLLDAGMPD